MTAERTLVLCKPDAVERGLVGEIVGRIERKGLSIVALEQRVLDVGTAKQHYAEHAGKPFFEDPGDERHQIFEKRLSGVLRGTLLRRAHIEHALLEGDDRESLALDPADDLTHQPALDRIRLAEYERAFGG